MGAGDGASAADCRLAERLGGQLAARGWAVLTGGRPVGVMAAAVRGAKRVSGSLTIGVLPTAAGPAVSDLDIAIFTGLGDARNAVNVLSSDVVVACGAGGPGTASEIALALKARKPVVLLRPPDAARKFFGSLPGRVFVAASVDEAVDLIVRRRLLPAAGRRQLAGGGRSSSSRSDEAT